MCIRLEYYYCTKPSVWLMRNLNIRMKLAPREREGEMFCKQSWHYHAALPLSHSVFSFNYKMKGFLWGFVSGGQQFQRTNRSRCRKKMKKKSCLNINIRYKNEKPEKWKICKRKIHRCMKLTTADIDFKELKWDQIYNENRRTYSGLLRPDIRVSAPNLDHLQIKVRPPNVSHISCFQIFRIVHLYSTQSKAKIDNFNANTKNVPKTTKQDNTATRKDDNWYVSISN